ncbi:MULTISPECIES: ABC transporter permease [Halomonadaceae]|jgi:peptide/nickel transport system permease protein|uniref:ABC transporter permease n=2 Tax=Billgrantia TaxID=3137761 RepID=A0ABS9AUN6_9GAMM|nr:MULTISPECIES: ABC transporter permease [Halomonas]MCE8010632.1 ABC transporter permease [Halomonas desiderata]MCE8025441.1 ABC transporter permease [Halomonas aerodenitrificans]MCE8037589.1 ABC transporter permease [Halomonas sp. MCCC 1A11062]MCE8041650.1 ABC transporter permease [Halomonas desiderata]MCE8046225.1 ABC transporter permease [Halomonas desiderata]
MSTYFLKRILYVVPITLAVSFFCFSLVHLSPGDPMDAVVSADAPREVVAMVERAYGFDRPLPEQFALWVSRALQGDLGLSAANGRAVTTEVFAALKNTLLLALAASLIGFTLGCTFGLLAGYWQGSLLDRLVTGFAVGGVSVPHYWLGMLLVIVFSVELNWLPSSGAGPGSSNDWAFEWAYLRHLILPAVTLSVIPMGVVTRTVRAMVAEILAHEFVEALRAKGLAEKRVFLHVVKNVAPTALAVMGLQLGYLLGGSILVETVFSWPGTGLLLNNAIFQRDLPILQGTILVLALFFVLLNLIVDLAQARLDPRIQRS